MHNSIQPHFKSRLGFIMAAAGSAVGVGNIWGFPTQAANHGGGAFLLIYIVLILILGYPMLMAELMIGRFAQSSPIHAMPHIANRPFTRIIGKLIGLCAIITATLICTFYSILSGWFISFSLAPIAKEIGAADSASWLVTFSLPRNLTFTLIFITIAILLIRQGVQKGIETWSKRLMPLLILILITGSIYILTQPGALTGLNLLLTPDFSKIWHADILISALGQTFFSLTVGTGAMMVYGSYLDQKDNIASLTAYVVLADTLIAFLAALMIIPAI